MNLNGGACVHKVLTVPVLVSELLVWPFTLIFRIWSPPRIHTLERRACFALAHLLPKSKSPLYALFLVYFQHEETCNLPGTVVKNKWDVMHNTFRLQTLNENKPLLSDSLGIYWGRQNVVYHPKDLSHLVTNLFRHLIVFRSSKY